MTSRHARSANPSTSREATLICPFCGEMDFDRIGLFLHLMEWNCEQLFIVSKEREREEEARRGM